MVTKDEETACFKVMLSQRDILYVVDGQHRRKAMDLVFEFLNKIQSSHVYPKKGSLFASDAAEISKEELAVWNECLDVARGFCTVTVEAHLGLNIDQERQLFHDLNNLGKKVEKSLALQFDSSNPINRYIKEVLVDDVLGMEPMEKDIINWQEDTGQLALKDIVAVNAILFLNKTNISGATLSCSHVTDGVRRIVAVVALALLARIVGKLLSGFVVQSVMPAARPAGPLLGIVLLLLPFIPGIGLDINGARIWIRFAGFSFQPGEVAKVLLVIAFSGYLVLHRDALALAGRRVVFVDLPRGRDLGPILAMFGVSMMILVLQNDLGSSLLFFGLFLAMLYVSTERPGWLVVGGLLFGGRVPPRVGNDHVVGDGQVQAEAAGLQADEEEIALAGLEAGDTRGSLGQRRLAVEVEVRDLARAQRLLDEREMPRELAEHQRTVAAFAQLAHELEERLELGEVRLFKLWLEDRLPRGGNRRFEVHDSA